MRPASGRRPPAAAEPDREEQKDVHPAPTAVKPAGKSFVLTKKESQISTASTSRTEEKKSPATMNLCTPRAQSNPKVKAQAANKGQGGGRVPAVPPPDDDRRTAQAQVVAARYNAESEASELRTLLKLPRDTPSSQVVHKLREAFHLMNIVERFRADLGRLLHVKEARTAEGALRAVQDLLRENEQLRQQVERQQDVVAKLQEDRRVVLERFHRLVRENRLKDYGSGSLLALSGAGSGSDAKSQSQEPGSRPAATASFSELTVVGTGERKDLATMLSSRIDHLLVPKTAQGDRPAPGTAQDQQQKELSPIYIRQKKNKDEKKLVYKITGIVRPTSSASSRSSLAGGSRPRTMPALAQSLLNPAKLPEIMARRRTPTPTHRVRMVVEGESIARPPSSLLSLTETATTTTGTTTTRSVSTATGVPRRAARSMGQRREDDKRRAEANLVSMSKRYSSKALSAAGSARQLMPGPPSSVQEQDESLGDFFGSISDVKKDDLVSLIFAPLLKDRYLSRFTLSPQGGVLSIPEVGLSLVVPEGALPVAGGSVDIVLGVSYNPADTPLVGAAYCVSTPSILCATRPARMRFHRPVALVFAHNSGALVPGRTRGTPRILQSLTEVGHVTQWQTFTSVDVDDDVTEHDGAEEFSCVTIDSCILFVNQLRLFSLTTEPGGVGRAAATKYVRIVVFVSYSPGRDCVALNVYCTDSLPSERQLLRRECLMDGTGVEVGEQPMVMYANSGDLLISVRNVPLGWQLHDQSHQSISYRKAWPNLHPHVTFVIECAPDTWESELTCSVHAQQVEADDPDASADIHVCCDLAQMEGCSDGSLFDNATATSGLRSLLRSQTGGLFNPNLFDSGGTLLLQDVDSDSLTAGAAEDVHTLLLHAAWPRAVHEPRVPTPLARQLAAKLDPPNLLGLDWRQLAAELNMDACVPHLTSTDQPTAYLLAATELLCAGLYELEAVLQRMGRDDAVAIVRAHRAHTANTTSGPGGKALPARM